MEEEGNTKEASTHKRGTHTLHVGPQINQKTSHTGDTHQQGDPHTMEDSNHWVFGAHTKKNFSGNSEKGPQTQQERVFSTKTYIQDQEGYNYD